MSSSLIGWSWNTALAAISVELRDSRMPEKIRI